MGNGRYITGVVCCLLATMSWGGMFPIMTDALRKMDPFTFTAYRYALAGLAFAALLGWREGRRAFSLKGERWVLAWLLGSAGFAGFGFLVFLGQQLAGPTGALTASIMMATMPMLGMFVIWALRKVRPPLFSFAFILLSFTGVLFVITKGHPEAMLDQPASFAASVPLILGALCWVVYTVGASYFPTWSAVRYTTLTTLLGMTSILAVDAVLVRLDVIPYPTLDALVSVAPHLAYMALIAGWAGVLCWNIGNGIITPLNGVLFMDVVPITAFVVSTLLGIVPESAQVAGASVTALALVLNNVFQRRAQRRAAVPAQPPAAPLGAGVTAGPCTKR